LDQLFSYFLVGHIVASTGSLVGSFDSINALCELLVVQEVILVLVVLQVERPDLLLGVVETNLL
jgi:hypothetical protein